MSTRPSSPTSMPPPEADRVARLMGAPSMTPVDGTTDLAIPIDELWRAFDQPRAWSRWNRCFFWAHNRRLRLGDRLVWAFQPLRWFYLYKMFAIARIVELVAEGPRRKVTWEVTALPGFFARHTYHMEDLGGGRTRFGSWEKAMGWSFALMRRFWIAHFRFVCDRSLEGARWLGERFAASGRLDVRTIPRPGRLRRAAGVALAALMVVGLGGGGWFYLSFVRQQVMPLAPGVHLVTGGGGNSLVIEDGGEVMVVDPKFGAGATSLRRWISSHTSGRVSYVVNTHYHYDHTSGNDLYPGATILAHHRVKGLLQRNEPRLLAAHPGIVPTDEVNGSRRLRIGQREVLLVDPGPAHTDGDLVVYLPRERILATGDLFFFTFYPMFDLRPGGASLAGLIAADRALAAGHGGDRIVPGHGPLARAADLEQYARYLELLRDGAVSRLPRRRILPSFHEGHLTWASAASNARDAAALVQASRLTTEENDHAAHR
jgi:cyclase